MARLWAEELPQPEEILILGIGNPLIGDDGAGIAAIELLSKCCLPPNVTVQEIGTPGWGLGAWFAGRKTIILVDAVQMGQEPGSWRRFELDKIHSPVTQAAFSLHQSDLACGISLAQELDLLPEKISLYGIEPADLTPGASLSPQVAANLPALVETIVNDVRRGEI